MNNLSNDTTVTNPMVEPTIRPIWVVIGAVLITLCGGLAVCLAVTGLGLNFLLGGEPDRSESVMGDRPTQVVAEVPTATIDVPTIIPMPGEGATLAPPPINSGGGNVAVDVSAPAQAVRSYYEAVDANRYDLSWPLLSNHFKDLFNCCAPNYNYTGYVDWWDSVERIDVRNVETVSQSVDRAVVYMELYYTMRSGGQSVDRSYIHLVYDATVGGWLFDNKTDTV